MKNMRNILGVFAISSLMIAPTFANVDENVSKDTSIKATPINLELDGSMEIMPISLESTDVKILDGADTDVMTITETSVEGVTTKPTDAVNDSVTTTGGVNDSLVFYKDGKTPKVYDSLEELLKNEKDVKYVTDGCNSGFVTPDGNVGMTMMYCMDVYGEGGREAWSRTDAKVVITGDDAGYVDEDLFQTMYDSKTVKNKVDSKISKVSTKKLEQSLDKINDIVNAIKLSRISKEFQDLQITILYFIKDSVQTELLDR